MARTFDRVSLAVSFPAGTVMGQCGVCGRGANHDDILRHPELESVELAGMILDPDGTVFLALPGSPEGEESALSFLCRRCYEASAERTFSLVSFEFDMLVEGLATVSDAMDEVTRLLDDGEGSAIYFPVRIDAGRDGRYLETIATIHLLK